MPPKKGGKGKAAAKSTNNNNNNSTTATKEEVTEVSPVTCTGSIKHLTFRDVHIENFSLIFHGKELIKDTELILSSGRRYGLLGLNGSGKSTLLDAIGKREVPIPEHIDLFHLVSEIPASDDSAIDSVLKVDEQRRRLEDKASKLEEKLLDEESDQDEINAVLNDIYERLDEMGAATATTRAATILAGLGFSADMQKKKTREFSGGWRMRIALARALFMKPTLLLLDEPTNHLDLEACVWLEDYLSKWNPKGILLLVSHSQDFLNNVCTNIIRLYNRKLVYYTGNYEQYMITRLELEEHQMKNYAWEQDKIKKMKDFIARFGHGSKKLARMAQSREKSLNKMTREGLTEAVVKERVKDFRFPDPDTLPSPVLQFQGVSFGYNDRTLYENLDFGIDLDSRVALVGPNGVGKSTLMKLMSSELTPTSGMVRPHTKLRMARFNQHFVDQLDMSLNPLQYMMQTFDTTIDEMRAWLGRFGITGPVQQQTMKTMSDGQKSRVIFAELAYRAPHILLLDEPTNHLDMETIDALADALNEFEGGVVLVSHDMRLIGQVAEEIWLCENKTVKVYEGDIEQYKDEVRARLQLLRLKVAGDIDVTEEAK